MLQYKVRVKVRVSVYAIGKSRQKYAEKKAERLTSECFGMGS